MDNSDDAETAMTLNQPAPPPECTLPPPRVWPQYLAAIAATLSFFAAGAAGSFNYYLLEEETTDLDLDDIRWLQTLGLLGAVAGAPLLGLVAHLWGRKWAAVLIQLLLILALSIGHITGDKQCLFLSSYTVGTAKGGAFAVVPIYVAEIADDIHRGIMGVFILAMPFLGSYLIDIGMLVTKYWLTTICALPTLLALGAAILMPETPPFLISKGRQHEATKVLRLLRGEYRQEWEIQALESSFSEKASILKPFMISLGLMTLWSLLIIDYSMTAVHYSLMDIVRSYRLPAVIMVLFGTVSLINAAAAVYFIKWRLLLLISCIGTTVGSLIVCLGHFVFDAPIVNMLGGFLAIASFFAAAGYLPHIMMVQLLPRKNNAITCSLITAFCLLLKFLQQYIFSYVFLFQYSMIFVTVVSALFTIYVFLFIPELKRKSVQTIQDELSHKSFIMHTL